VEHARDQFLVLGQRSPGHPLVPVWEGDVRAVEGAEAMVVSRVARGATHSPCHGLRR
jgi:hypothetical protein